MTDSENSLHFFFQEKDTWGHFLSENLLHLQRRLVELGWWINERDIQAIWTREDDPRIMSFRNELLAEIKDLETYRAIVDRAFLPLPPEEGKKDISPQKQKEAELKRWDKRIRDVQDMIKALDFHIDCIKSKRVPLGRK
jgi:hypothetical protein